MYMYVPSAVFYNKNSCALCALFAQKVQKRDDFLAWRVRAGSFVDEYVRFGSCFLYVLCVCMSFSVAVANISVFYGIYIYLHNETKSIRRRRYLGCERLQAGVAQSVCM